MARTRVVSMNIMSDEYHRPMGDGVPHGETTHLHNDFAQPTSLETRHVGADTGMDWHLSLNNDDACAPVHVRQSVRYYFVVLFVFSLMLFVV